VREAVIQVILHVARNFPVIRFDAAMTLAKKHVQRLWFPEPGAGGAIPSRSQYGMTKSEFDEKVPEEFWREVVDRVAKEVPDTLLLAEAFWLMEGYFVRTLGMHRVYNSAFMHMLRDEDNAKYRLAIKNTLEFDPQILKRYVNFMNNPDEKSAIEQFGSGDKYFGICTVLSTLPGLPMFGHGQVEGYSEKYGMEFRRAKWDETPDEGLIRGHEWKIFPLLHRRYLFADVEQFLLYDFYSPNGGADWLSITTNLPTHADGSKPPPLILINLLVKLYAGISPRDLAYRALDMSSSRIMSPSLNTSAPARKFGTRACMLNWAHINVTPSWIGALSVMWSGEPFAIN
jgi:hypothetical protein